jgi:hypothetical protein
MWVLRFGFPSDILFSSSFAKKHALQGGEKHAKKELRKKE